MVNALSIAAKGVPQLTAAVSVSGENWFNRRRQAAWRSATVGIAAGAVVGKTLAARVPENVLGG